MLKISNYLVPIKKTIYLIDRKAIYLFILIFFVYNINLRIIENGDAISASLLPFSILGHHNYYLDEFSTFLQSIQPFPWMVREVHGHYLSAYPIVAPTIVTPIYIIPYIFLTLIHYPIDMLDPGFQLVVDVIEKISASILAAAAGVFVYLSLKEMIDNRIAIITAAIFAFATSTWSTSSQQLWQHGLVELILSILIYFVLMNEKTDSKKNVACMGILSGLYIFNRPSDLILLLPIFIYIIYTNNIYHYFVSLFLVSTPFLLYNMYYFDSLFGGYGNLLSEFSLNFHVIDHLMGLLISPSRGILIYSPIIIFSIFGFAEVRKIDNINTRNLLILFGLAAFLQVLIYSCFSVWWSGGSYGPRFLTGMLPILAIFMGIYFNKIVFANRHSAKRIILLCLILILIIWSVFVQVIGVFYYPNGNWNGSPEIIDQSTERLWNWNDMEIFRTYDAGPIRPSPSAGFRLILNSLPKENAL